MGLFSFMKGNQSEAAASNTAAFPMVLGSMVQGQAVSMEQIPDEVFSQGILGKCCGVDPDVGNVYAPIDGKISQVTDTLHAVGMEAGEVEILIHVGIDTVEMNGDGFAVAVKLGQTVKKGDLLLTMDLDKIRAAEHPATIVMVVTNSDDFTSVEQIGTGHVQLGDDLLRVSK